MTENDLKHMQDGFLDAAKKILRVDTRLRPVGFIVTLHKHVDKLHESGWGVEFIDFKSCLRDDRDDKIAVLVLDLAMDYKRLYHAVLNVFPKARGVLPGMIALAESLEVDDPYLRTMRPFMQATQLHEKDIVAAVMRQICDKVDAFACVMQSEMWLRVVDPLSETVDQIYKDAGGSLRHDKKSVEVVGSAMETYDFMRMITLPILREASNDDTCDGGQICGFGEPHESIDRPGDGTVVEGRLVRFLKPLPEAS